MDKEIDLLIDLKTGGITSPDSVDICLVMRVSDSSGPHVKSYVTKCSECKLDVWADNNTSSILKLGKAQAVCKVCFFEKYKDKL